MVRFPFAVAAFCVAVLVLVGSKPASAQTAYFFAQPSHSTPVRKTLSFTQAGQVQSIPLTIASNQVMDIDNITVTPSSAQADVLNSMTVRNAAGQAVESGQTAEIDGGTGASSTPVSLDFTSNVNQPVTVTLDSRTVTQRGLFNNGSSDSSKAPVVRTKSFTLSGSEYSGGTDIKNYKVHLRAGEVLYVKSAQAFGPSGYDGMHGVAWRAIFADGATICEATVNSKFSNYISNGWVSPTDSDYILQIQAAGYQPVFNKQPVNANVGYSLTIATSLATQAPGHGGHP